MVKFKVLFNTFFFVLSFCALIFFSNCGNVNEDKGKLVVDDSATSDIRLLNEKINKDRNNPDLYFQRAKANFIHKKFEDAATDMSIALKIDSTNPDYYIFISDLTFTQNKTRDTRDALRKAILYDSSNSQALMKYSQLFYLLRKFDTATFYINRSLHYNNSSSVAHFQKGMILKEWGDTAKAITSFSEALERDQKYYDALVQLGILYSLKRNPLAVGYFDNALSINPKSIEVLYAKGLFFQNTFQYDQALKVYNLILDLETNHPDANYNIAVIFYEQKKIDEALKRFDDLLLHDSNFYRGYYGKGLCYEARKEESKAVIEYQKCLSIKSDFELASQRIEIISGKVHP